jgi:putative sterol carrier protein
MAESLAPQQASSLAELMERIPQAMTSQQLNGVNATVQLRSIGDETSEWTIVVQNNQYTITPGPAQAPDVALEATANVWTSLLKRQLDPAWAYMSGQLRVSGDLNLAMRLQSLIGG